MRLFERHSRGDADPGRRRVPERAARALIAVEEAEEALEPWLRAAPRLVIGFHEAAGDLARALIRRLMRAHPEVDVETRHLLPGGPARELKRGRIDAELVYPPAGDEQLLEHAVALSPRYVLVSEDHPLAGECTLTFDQVEHEMLPGRDPTVDERLADETWLMEYRCCAAVALRRGADLARRALGARLPRPAIVILPLFMISRLQGDGLRAIPLLGVDGIPVVSLLRGDARPVIRTSAPRSRGWRATRPGGPGERLRGRPRPAVRNPRPQRRESARAGPPR